MKSFFFILVCLSVSLLDSPADSGSPPPTQEIAVTVVDGKGADLSPAFLGLSYESSMLLPKYGHYYFDANDQALVNTFKTLGIKSLRVGANAVDDPKIAIPQEPDIDALFNFARAAGVKVIYSFRLKNGDPAVSARLASYISSHDADSLDSFSIGNEPDFFLKKYDDFFKAWKPHYDAILKAVPSAMIDGPSAYRSEFILNLAHDLFADGHLALLSEHAYFLGGGRQGEKDPAGTRARFLSNADDTRYGNDYAKIAKVLAAQSIPFRLDELNSCYNGGAKGASDTYASTLWVLDCTHWWAAHRILGMNYHTGESVGRNGTFGAPNYAAFLRQPEGPGFDMRPQAYGLLAFTRGAHGQPLEIQTNTPSGFDFTAYGYRADDGSVTVTLINKSFGDKARTASVSLLLPPGIEAGNWQRMNLEQNDGDIAAQTGVTLGGSVIAPMGTWSGQWKDIESGQPPQVQVAPASAAILRFVLIK